MAAIIGFPNTPLSREAHYANGKEAGLWWAYMEATVADLRFFVDAAYECRKLRRFPVDRFNTLIVPLWNGGDEDGYRVRFWEKQGVSCP